MNQQPAFIYANYASTATAIATDTASGYSAAYVLEATQDLAWKPANTTGSKNLTLDLGLSVGVSGVALVGEYLNGVTLEIRGSTDNFSSSNVQLSAPAVINTGLFVTTYRRFNLVNYRYIRLIFSGHSSSFEVQHVAAGAADLLPFLAGDHDPDAYKTEGSYLVSVSGYLLGASRQRTMRDISLNFGQVSAAEFQLFELWASVCVVPLQGFFYVPDTGDTDCFFGWVDSKYKFTAPYKNGMRNLAAIPFVARVS